MPALWCFFYSLRVLINVLVMGCSLPIAHFVEKSRIYYEGQSLFSFLLVMIGGTGLLIGIVLYYRRFLVEFFISRQRKMQRPFLGREPACTGMFVFPFAITCKGRPAHQQKTAPGSILPMPCTTCSRTISWGLSWC